MRKDKKEFTLDVVSGIDEEIVDRNLAKRYKLWQRRGKRGRVALISLVAALLSICLVVGAFMIVPLFGKQVPVYQGMTVSTEAPTVPESALALPMPVASVLSTSNTLPAHGLVPLGEQETLETQADTEGETEPIIFGKTYYALKNEDIYIHIHIDNPDGFEIVSFTLNGVKYTNYMFEPGSDLETLILKYNVGDVDGLQEYTIDAIKYIDGEAIKDVRMKGDKTVKVYVNDDTQALSFVTETEFTTLRFTPVWNESFTGDKTIQTLELYEGEELLRELSPTDTEIKDLPMGKRLVLVATYVDGGEQQTLRYVFDMPKYSEGLQMTGGVITGMGTCTDSVLYLNAPIGEKAFESNNGIYTVYLGPGVTSVGSNAFHACTKLSKVVLSESPISLGEWVFAECISLADVSLSGQVAEIPDYAYFACESLESIVIPEGVTKLGVGVFEACGKLKSVQLPESLKSVGATCFSQCWVLESIELPDGITEIGANPFNSCYSLKSIKLPASLTEIPDSMFSRLNNLYSIVIPESVTSIGHMAFIGSALGKVEFPESVTSIGIGAFLGCENLRSVTIPASVTYVEWTAFSQCENLKTMYIEGNDTKFVLSGAAPGQAPFEIRYYLNDVHYTGTMQEWQTYYGNASRWAEMKCTVHCTDGDIAY